MIWLIFVKLAWPHNNWFPAVRCNRATLFGKSDDLQLTSLRVHNPASKDRHGRILGLCRMVEAEPLEATGS
jgi:hypothetical protein